MQGYPSKKWNFFYFLGQNQPLEEKLCPNKQEHNHWSNCAREGDGVFGFSQIRDLRQGREEAVRISFSSNFSPFSMENWSIFYAFWSIKEINLCPSMQAIPIPHQRSQCLRSAQEVHQWLWYWCYFPVWFSPSDSINSSFKKLFFF